MELNLVNNGCQHGTRTHFSSTQINHTQHKANGFRQTYISQEKKKP